MEAYKKLSNGRHLVITWVKDWDYSETKMSYYDLKKLVNDRDKGEVDKIKLERLEFLICPPIPNILGIEIIEAHISPIETRHIIQLTMYELAQINDIIKDLGKSMKDDPERYPSMTLKKLIETGEFFD